MNTWVSLGFWNIAVTLLNIFAAAALIGFIVWLALRRRAKVWKCPSCGRTVRPHYRVCPYCGADLQEKRERDE